MYNDQFTSKGDIPYHPRREPKYDVPLTPQHIREIFADCADFQAREISIGGQSDFPAHVFFLDGLISGGEVAENVLCPLTSPVRFGTAATPEEAAERMRAGLVYCASSKPCPTTDEAVTALLGGFCLVVFPGAPRAAVAFEARTSTFRGVSDPLSERCLKGARDAFVETLRVNTSLVRRHLRCAQLKFVQTTIGRKSGTTAEIAYVDGVADPDLVRRIQDRLDGIDIDGLITTSALEAYISDAPRSPFPQIMSTERPDRFCLNLLEGRVGLLVDGIPLGWLLPATLSQQLRVPDDIAKHFAVASALTFLRHLALLIAVLFPAIYVAVAMYHQEMIPTKLLLSIISSKQQVPFSTALEVLGMLVAFELLQEAGLRLPSSIGQTVSIIGALIVGQSAVEARVISPIAVIVVATAGIAGYTIPNQDLSEALRLARFGLVAAAILAGMFGIAAGCILLVYHTASLDSLGVAYLAPNADGGIRALLRTLFQPPLYRGKRRDPHLHTPDKRRQK